MYLAKNKNNQKIYIDDVLNTDYKNEIFYCPICEGELIVKNGNINIAHFAHKLLKDCDSFTSDMSEWHKSWQNKFPKENREIIIEYNGEKHRADVCINDCVIEFQHSSISQEEFNKKCTFYTDAGYTLFWVFDHIEDIEDYNKYSDEYILGNIFCYNNLKISRSFFTGEYITSQEEYLDEYGLTYFIYRDAGSKYKWKNPPKFMRDLIPQDQTDIFIFFDFGCGIEKVKWASLNQYDKADYKCFITDSYINYNDFVKYFKNRNRDNICPDCGYPLISKNGKYGSFIGCSNYPYCKYVKNRQ